MAPSMLPKNFLSGCDMVRPRLVPHLVIGLGKMFDQNLVSGNGRIRLLYSSVSPLSLGRS